MFNTNKARIAKAALVASLLLGVTGCTASTFDSTPVPAKEIAKVEQQKDSMKKGIQNKKDQDALDKKKYAAAKGKAGKVS